MFSDAQLSGGFAIWDHVWIAPCWAEYNFLFLSFRPLSSFANTVTLESNWNSMKPKARCAVAAPHQNYLWKAPTGLFYVNISRFIDHDVHCRPRDRIAILFKPFCDDLPIYSLYRHFQDRSDRLHVQSCYPYSQL